jgi:hypothetical protein
LPDNRSIVGRDWEKAASAAERYMAAVASIPGVLIEVAAQHPLKAGVTPGQRFMARLTRGIELFDEYRLAGYKVEIYVPGSRHRVDERDDTVSLSTAGTRFLIAQGVPADVVHGDDLNELYRGENGVYGSADECWVASRYFRDAGFGHLVVVCSPTQLLRKAINYIGLGLVPLMYSVPGDGDAMTYVREALSSVPDALGDRFDENTGESTYSEILRRSRRPRDGE